MCKWRAAVGQLSETFQLRLEKQSIPGPTVRFGTVGGWEKSSSTGLHGLLTILLYVQTVSVLYKTHQVKLVSSIKLFITKRCEWLIYSIVLFEHFQMIQAIQVLRFHLLELEKVIFSHHLFPTCLFKPTWAALAEMHFCSSLVISVKINHGAISPPRLITTQAVTSGTASAELPAQTSPRVLMKFYVGRNCTQGEPYMRTLEVLETSLRRGWKGPGQPCEGGGALSEGLRIRWTPVACAVSLTVMWTIIKAV